MFRRVSSSHFGPSFITFRDDAKWARRFDDDVDKPDPPCRVAVLVQPTLLAEALCLALRAENLDVSVIAEEAEVAEGAFDIVIVTGSLPEGLTDAVIVRIPSDQQVHATQHPASEVAAADFVGLLNAVGCGRR